MAFNYFVWKPRKRDTGRLVRICLPPFPAGRTVRRLWLDGAPDQQKIDGNRNGVDGYRRPVVVDAGADKDVKQGNLHQVVDGMAQQESCAAAGGGFAPEGVDAAQIEIGDEADDIPECETDAERQDDFGHEVDGIMYAGGCRSHDGEAKRFLPTFT